MSPRLIARLRILAIVVGVCTLVGFIDGMRENAIRGDEIPYLVEQTTLSWFLGSGLTYAFELLFVPSRHGETIRRMHFLVAIVVKSIILLLVVFLVSILGDLVFRGIVDWTYFLDPERRFLQTLALVFGVVITLQVAIQVARIIGTRNLINFVLGRYRHPIAEDRIFMFLDIAGSTTLAESLGDVGVQKLITRFFFDISEPIAEHGGEIHQYVGDEVVVTWPLRTPDANLRAINCAFAIAERVRDKGPGYEKAFGVVPKFRIGLHGGPIVISQCGDQKQEISYFGDTINTASRVAEACKTFGCALLVSGDLLNRVALPDRFRSTLMGTVQLRGRAHETDLLGVTLDGVELA